MPQVSLESLPWQESVSPKGRFGVAQRHVSLALGGKKDTGLWGGGHPFDLAQTKIAPGLTGWPLHAHTTQWELYVFTAGEGELVEGDEVKPVRAGDCCLLPPGVAHQLRNTGAEDLVYFVVADNPQAEICYYPNSEKWMIKPQRKWFRMDEVDYYEGEE